MKRKFTIRPAEWPSQDQEWELVFTTVFDEHQSNGSVERVSLVFLQNMYSCIGEFLQSDAAHKTPEQKPEKHTRYQVT